MICTDCVYASNLLAEHHGVVCDEVDEVVGRALAREELELLVHRSRPCDDNACGNLGGCIADKVRGHPR